MVSFKGWYANPGWKEDQLFESLSVASFHLSLRRADFERSRGYDEEFPHAGFEDFDFPLRLKKAGVQFFIDTRQKVYHNEADRTTMKPWLENQERRAITRAIAVHRGYSELTLNYTPAKRRVLSLVLVCQPLIRAFMRVIPSGIGMDSLVFKLVGALQAAKIYRGYMAGMKQ
jgi:GT2 family glycosyltransferase